MKTSIAFKPANRQQDSIVAPIEKRILARLAARMPGWVNPDHLTLLGFAGMALAGLSYYLARWNRWMLLASVAFLAVNWFGDSLDGTLARYRNRQRPRYGFYVDHMVDALGILFLIGGLGLSGYMSPLVAMALMIAYYLLSIEIYLATYTIGVFKLSFGIWGPTELRILLAAGNIALIFQKSAQFAGHSYLLADAGAVVAIAVLALLALYSAVRNTLRLYAEERLSYIHDGHALRRL
ncbi:MAG TPA: CDP-alcohol phosphatidyltransferase family protein [Terriglobia bacterium]|nr:CDP-alcohol phosphatidyltransferase family protein [Terriglobia bacterium]